MGKPTEKMNEQSVAAAPSAPPAHLFRWRDWAVAVAAFLISGAVFLYYMSPSVTLEDSGELVTGAFNFGVPHPPGYPLWAFLGWVWRHLVSFGNPAWRICLMSVLTGALVVGVMTLFMSRSILMLLRASPWAWAVDEELKHWMALFIGASASLLFGFNRGVWLWASVPEMRVLSVFLFTLTACTFFIWMMRPEKYAFLYLTIFIYALGITNHQTIVVMIVPFLAGAVAAGWWSPNNVPGRRMASLCALWELLVALLFGWAVGVVVNAWLLTPSGESLFAQKVSLLLLFGPPQNALSILLLAVGAGVALLVVGANAGWLNPKRALICAALFLLGNSFYLYMPIASATNPPMNWGYAATKQGFLHAVTRGQYERLHTASPFSEQFRVQVSLFLEALSNQYSLALVLIGVVPLALLIVAWKQLQPRARSWLLYVWVAFLTTSLGLLTIINPGLEKQQQEINIKFFAPAHGFYAILIGYGLALLIAAALARWPTPLMRLGARGLCLALLALPAISFSRNWAICEQRGHDFGYQFGYRMFYPGGDYPPMDKDAVLYGGTDPGRFVPTYMIFCESRVAPQDRFQDPHCDPAGGKNFDRRDVYIITQNALADSTYMSYIRDHYDYSRPDWNNPSTLTNRPAWQQQLFGWAWQNLYRSTMYPREPIWIPSDQDVQRAFQEYVQGLKSRPPGPDENVEIINGRVSVRGVGGVMAINGILTKWIFDRNKDKHSFYVEESYVIPWMYPYLEPAGIIMKINKEPLPPPDQDGALWMRIVQRDRAYWDKLEKELTARPEFRRDGDAQKTFSKLRSAIGGLYANRRMVMEAEYAYQQARKLCPESPEANFRLAQLYMELGRVDDAVKVLRELQALDPLNAKIEQAIQQILAIKQARQDIGQLEAAHTANPADVRLVLQLAQNYFKAGAPDRIPALCDGYLAQTNLAANDMIQVAQVYISMGQADRAVATLRLILSRFPQDSQALYALAIIRGAQGATDEALSALEQALIITPSLRDQARTDQRLGSLRNHPRYAQIVR